MLPYSPLLVCPRVPLFHTTPVYYGSHLATLQLLATFGARLSISYALPFQKLIRNNPILPQSLTKPPIPWIFHFHTPGHQILENHQEKFLPRIHVILGSLE
jgi:hypothetical protein